MVDVVASPRQFMAAIGVRFYREDLVQIDPAAREGVSTTGQVQPPNAQRLLRH